MTRDAPPEAKTSRLAQGQPGKQDGPRRTLAVLDANVLFPFTLRDTLLRAAEAELYRAYWSEEILEEATRNLVKTGRMSESQAGHLRTQINAAFPEASISGYEALIESMENNAKDRHVVAAAVTAGAHVIVTCNLKDFASLPPRLEARHPDDFLLRLLKGREIEIAEVLKRQAAALKNPAWTLSELLATLEKSVPKFARAAREAPDNSVG